MNSTLLTEENHYARFNFRNFGKIHALVVYSGSEPSCLDYVDLVQKLEESLPRDDSIVLAYVDVDEYPSAITEWNIEQVPTVVVLSNPSVVKRTLNVSPTSLFIEVEKLVEEFKLGYEADKEKYMQLCKRIVEGSDLVVFIKGTPTQPKCKFTKALLKEFRTLNLQFNFYDMDADQSMRQYLKYYSGQKTFPQIFSQGKLIGGMDVFK